MRQIDNRDRFAPRDRPEPHWSEVLRALRETAGVTQEGWAARLGYGRRTIQRWEHAELAPDAAAAEALVGLCTQLGLFREHQRGVLAGLRLTPEWLGAVLVDARAAGPSAPAPVRVLTSGAPGAPALRVPLTSFVGRQREMAEVRRLLGTTRLLTLTGPGGVGKTRLALEVARAVSAEFSSGMWLVELGPLADPELVPQALATVLGMREQPGRPLLATLADRLRGRRVLVLLDNCEHLIGACAELAATLLPMCPELCILATSRVVLGVSGETTWPVPALSAPGPQRASAPEAESCSDAVQLFVQRASAVAPRFALTEDTTPAIVNICARLDGLPLAIELAAAWIRMLSPHELARRLADPFALLVSAAPDTPPRQRTLRATLDWSYGLLAEPERRLLARLSVFADGATLEAIEAVAGNAGERGEAVLHGLAHLVDASLVQRVETPGAGVRFRLLDTVREYAQEQLMSLAEAEDARRRHATTFRDLAEEARAYLQGPQQGTWLDRLERDHGNLRAALGWAIERDDAESASRLAASLGLFWYHRGHFREGRALLDAVLAMPAGPVRPTIHVEMLKGNALLALGRGESAAARSYAEEGVQVARQQSDRASLMETLGVLGFVARAQGDPMLALRSLQESLGFARDMDDTHGAARCLHHLGLLALEAERDHMAAWSLSEQSLMLARRIGERRLEGNILMAMARVARAQGKTSTARSLLAEASTAYLQVGDPGPVPGFLATCAAVAADAGDLERGVRLAALAAGLRELVGTQEGPALRELNSWLPAARRALGEETFAATWAQAAAMTLTVENAVARALAEASSTTVGGPTA